MSRSLNKVSLLGYVGQDPDVRFNASGSVFATLSLATSESWTDKESGEKQDRTEWHRLVFNGKLAEICGQYIFKGSQIYVEGKIKTKKWVDQKTGQDKFATDIACNHLIMLGSQNTMEDNGRQQGAPQHPAEERNDDLDDVPF